MSPLGPQGPGSEPGLQLPAQAGGWGWKGSLVLKGPPFRAALRLRAPTSSPGVEVVVEVSAHSESPTLQPCSQEPCGRRGVVRAAPQPGGQDGTGANGAYPYSDPGGEYTWCQGGPEPTEQWGGMEWNQVQGLRGLPLLQDPRWGPGGPPGATTRCYRI